MLREKGLFMVAKKPLLHSLVPVHELVPKEEGVQLMHKYGIDTEKLPVIAKDDAGLDGLDAEKGAIIKVVRKSATAGESIYFRVVG